MAGGIGDAAIQFATTGKVNLRGVATSALVGGVFGGLYKGKATSACHSFDPKTRVLMADGSTKAIKDVKVGDKVAATDPKTGATVARLVTVLHANHDTDLTDVTVVTRTSRGPPSRTVLHTTQHHPFWDRTMGAWVVAAELVAGHQLLALNGSTVTVVAADSHTDGRDMRDLTVDEVHTYYVVAGGTPLLVHNTGPECPLYFAGAAKTRGNDIPSDEAGNVHPPSPDDIAALDVHGKSTYKSVPQLEAANLSPNQQIREMPSLPEGVGAVADGADVGGPNPDGHVTLFPTRVMPREEFDGLLNDSGWKNTGKKTQKRPDD
jgi:hypothetical protein